MAAAASNNPLVQIAEEYTEHITKKFRESGYIIEPTQPAEDIYRYTIKTDDNQDVGHVEIASFVGEQISGPITRRGESFISHALKVLYLAIEQDYQRKGLATKLLLYGICDLYARNPVYIGLILDDDTDTNINKLNIKHIYTRLGIMPRNDLVELNLNSPYFKIKRQGTNPMLSGPERYIRIDYLIRRVTPYIIKRNIKINRTNKINRIINTYRKGLNTRKNIPLKQIKKFKPKK